MTAKLAKDNGRICNKGTNFWVMVVFQTTRYTRLIVNNRVLKSWLQSLLLAWVPEKQKQSRSRQRDRTNKKCTPPSSQDAQSRLKSLFSEQGKFSKVPRSQISLAFRLIWYSDIKIQSKLPSNMTTYSTSDATSMIFSRPKRTRCRSKAPKLAYPSSDRCPTPFLSILLTPQSKEEAS